MDLIKRMMLMLVCSGLMLAGRMVDAEIGRAEAAQDLEQGTKAPMDTWRKDCGKSYSSMCLKLDVISFVDRLSEQDDIGLLPGVSVVKQNDSSAPAGPDVVASLARDFPKDVDRRMDAYLVHRIGAYLSSHAISIRLFDPRTFEAARSFNQAALERLGLIQPRDKDGVVSARKKDKNGYQGLMAGLMMMKGTLGALGFGALAMLAGKALMTGLIALMLSAVLGLKSLTSGEKKTTYEIVSKPVYTSSHVHSSEEHHGGYAAGGYARSLDAEEVREAIRPRDRRAVFSSRA